MDRNPRNFNPHKIKQRYCTVLLLYYNSKQKHTVAYNWPADSQQVLSSILLIRIRY